MAGNLVPFEIKVVLLGTNAIDIKAVNDYSYQLCS